MARYGWLGCGLLGVLLLAGCGADDDSTMREAIALKNEMAEIYEGVTDETSFVAAKQKIRGLNERITALKTKTDSWSNDRKDTLAKKYLQEMTAASDRLERASAAASKFGKTPPRK
jgi:hypothetical protein